MHVPLIPSPPKHLWYRRNKSCAHFPSEAALSATRTELRGCFEINLRCSRHSQIKRKFVISQYSTDFRSLLSTTAASGMNLPLISSTDNFNLLNLRRCKKIWLRTLQARECMCSGVVAEIPVVCNS
jgi:hypothetical protein